MNDDLILTKDDYKRAAQLENERAREIGENSSFPGGRAIRDAALLRRDMFRRLSQETPDAA